MKLYVLCEFLKSKELNGRITKTGIGLFRRPRNDTRANQADQPRPDPAFPHFKGIHTTATEHIYVTKSYREEKSR